MDTVIEAKRIEKRFGELTAVDGVTFSVKRGECFGILGPNGAGKTTTVRMIYGMSPLTDGELRVFGLKVPEQLRTIKYRIGVCQQEDTLDPELTVEQNLRVFARYFDLPGEVAEERAGELLALMELSQKKSAKVSEISGGMKRRLLIARSLVNVPELLILDEPTSGLDPQARRKIWERIEKLKREGITVLLTTHNMDEASYLCDRLIIMDHGRIIVLGNPETLVSKMVGRHVVEICGASGDLRSFISATGGVKFDEAGERLVIYGQDVEDLFTRLSTEFQTTAATLRMANLEDLFLTLTGRELRE